MGKNQQHYFCNFYSTLRKGGGEGCSGGFDIFQRTKNTRLLGCKKHLYLYLLILGFILQNRYVDTFQIRTF